MQFIVICIVVVLAVAIILGLRDASHRNKAHSQRPGSGSKKQTRRAGIAPLAQDFRAVSLRFKSAACKSVRELEGRTFLVRNAPHLPLHGCDSQHCDCTYKHRDDRRSDAGDRRAVSGLSTDLYGQSGAPERRGGHVNPGRRADDWLPV